MHIKFEPRPALDPFFSLSSTPPPTIQSSLQNATHRVRRDRVGSTHDLLAPLVESKNEETKGTIAPFAEGSGERTVRAHNHAMTVARRPIRQVCFRIQVPNPLFCLIAHPLTVVANVISKPLSASAVPTTTAPEFCLRF